MKNEESRLIRETQEAQTLPPAGQANIAYEILLLQQRLAAYEQLHVEEMSELRQEIERLRRAFLQGTSSYLRPIPARQPFVEEVE